MKLLRAKLNGFIGLRDGMGVESIDLDLSGLSGLVALEGDNGRGKTTLLENLQPFRTLPSRGGRLKKHCYLKNSSKDLRFEMSGDIYRTLIKMDPTTTAGDEGFIWKNGESVVDGKVTNYDRYLADLMGSQNLYFNSIFCAQNSAKLSDLRPAELKALFAEFLRLDRYIAWEKSAKSMVAAYIAAETSALVDVEKITLKIKMLGNPRGDLKCGKKVKAGLETQKIDADKQVGVHTHELELQRKATTASLIAAEKLIVAKKNKDDIVERAEALDQKYAKTALELEARSTAIKTESRETEKVLEDKFVITQAVNLIKETEQIMKGLEIDVDVAEMEIVDITARGKNERERETKEVEAITEIDRDLASLENIDVRQMKVVEQDIVDNQDQKQNIHKDPELIKIEAQIAAAEKSAAVLGNIAPSCPCPPEICGLITVSLEDKARLPTLRAEYDDKKNAILNLMEAQNEAFTNKCFQMQIDINVKREGIESRKARHETRLSEIRASIKTLLKSVEDKTAAKDAAKKEIEVRKKTVESNRPIAGKAPEILIAQSRLIDLGKQLADIKARSDRENAEYTKENMSLTLQEQAAIAEVLSLEKLIDDDAEDKLIAIEGRLSDAGKAVNDLAGQIAKNDTVIAACLTEIKQLLILEEDLRQAQGLAETYRFETSEWSYLAEACGKDGLRALEIEGVAPVLTAHANDMLISTFGPTQTIRFETQDEDGREVLDIVVINADGSESLLSLKSGGERVWILKALSLSQTLISQEKSGRHFQTALMDEEDGALSTKNAIKFIKLYRTLMDMAKMDTCLFISHRPEAIAMADHRIKLEKGGISII